MVLNPKTRLALVVIAAALNLSGCVWGNHEVDPPGPTAIQGYYESQMVPQITLYATIATTNTAGTMQYASVASSVIGQNSLAYIMLNEAITDPVYLGYDSSNGFFTLQPQNNPNPEFTWILATDDAGDLQTPQQLQDTAQLMPDTHPDCEFNIAAQAGGTYGQPNGPFTTGTTLPLSGRIALTTDIVFQPNNDDCSALAACYNSASSCDANDNADVQAEFSPFINAKLITATQIPDVTQLEYVVSYQ